MVRRHGDQVARSLLVIVLIVCLLSGCKSKQSTGAANPPAETASASVEGSGDGKVPDSISEAAQGDAPSSPPIGQLRVAQEVLLHASLYRAAFLSRVGDAQHFILEPVGEDFPPNLGVDPAEFRSRVLQQLADMQSPVAWAPSTWRIHAADTFPGTNEPATRLTARIISRDDDQATITAEIGDRTADSRSSRQTVTAIWDGVEWRIERGRARVVW